MPSLKSWIACLLLGLVIFLSACRPSSPTPTPAPATPPVSPTVVPGTFAPTPTQTPSPTPTPTPTPAPPTPTPLPTWPDRWEQVGPSGGLIQAVAVDPTAPNTLYAAGAGGAVYKSEDGGETWTPGEQLVHPTCLFADLVVDAHAVYAANACGGLYQSSDAGLTWSPVSASIVSRTTRMAQSPHAPGLLLAAGPGAQVYRSTDSATTWETINQGLPDAPIQSLAASAPDVYWATTASEYDGSLYRFSAGYWSPAPLPPDAVTTDVVVDPIDPNLLFVALALRSTAAATARRRGKPSARACPTHPSKASPPLVSMPIGRRRRAHTTAPCTALAPATGRQPPCRPTS